jgi:hypothetical protein
MTAAVTTETTKTLIFMPLIDVVPKICNGRLYTVPVPTEIQHRYIPNNLGQQ